MKVSAKDFEKAQSILEVGAIVRELKAKGADIREVHMLASVRKRELLQEQRSMQSLRKVHVNTLLNEKRTSTLSMSLDTMTSANSITLTSDSQVRM